jgi:molybdopterin-guanine dinucleotide biosynthesis protein B
MIPVISIVGKSDVGKTTLIEKLLRELKRRGYKVATIKYDVHGFILMFLERILGGMPRQVLM